MYWSTTDEDALTELNANRHSLALISEHFNLFDRLNDRGLFGPDEMKNPISWDRPTVTELVKVFANPRERVPCTINLEYFTAFGQAQGTPTSQSTLHRT